MTKRKKVSRWIAVGVGSLLLLLVIAMIALPLLIDQQQVKESIRSSLSRQVGGEVEFDTIQASFFPPQGEISGLRLQLPHISGAAGSVNADFEILPLFRGKLKIDAIFIKDPNFTISLPETAEEAEKLREPLKEWSPARIREKVSDVLSRVEANMPDVSITVQNGAVLVTQKGNPLYRLENLGAEIDLTPDKLKIDLASASNVWESMTFTGKIDVDGSNASGELKVIGLRPKPLMRYFAWRPLKDFESARVTLKLGFESRDFDTIRGKLQGSAVYEKIPYPIRIMETKFVYSGEDLVLNDFNIRAGKSHLGASSVRLDLKEKKNLKIKSAAAEFHLGQTFPWAAPLLSQTEGLKDIAGDCKDLRGTLSFSSLDLEGSLMQPGEWKFAAKGTAENFVFEAEKLPAPLKLERGQFEGTEERMTIKLQRLDLAGSSLWLSGYLEDPLADTGVVDISIRGAIGSETLQWITGQFELPAQITPQQGRVKINKLRLKGPISKWQELSFEGSGAVENLVVKTGLLPDAVALDKGGFFIGPEVLSLKEMQVDFLNSSMTLSGTLKGYMGGLSSLDMKFNGAVSEKATGWLKDQRIIPSWLKTATPVSLSEGHLVWGRQLQTVFAADLTMENGPQLDLNLIEGPQKLTIKSLTINDPTSQATVSMTLGDNIVDVDFQGELSDETLQKLLDRQDLSGRIRGDFSLHVPTQRLMETRLQGNIQAEDFTYGNGLHAVLVREISVQAEGDKIRIDSADLLWRETDMEVNGNVRFSPKGIVLDLVASTEGLDWEKINRIVQEVKKESTQAKKKRETPEREGTFSDLKLEGKVVLKADYFKYGDMTWKPFHLMINLQNKRLGLQLTQGNLCGIRMKATARVTPEPMRIEAEAEAQDKPLGPALDCFLENKLMSGEFDLAGEVSTRGSAENLLDNLQGQFSFTAENGRIFKYGLLAKILAVINITEILKGQAPDLKGAGFEYKFAKASGVIEDGRLTLNESYIHGKSVDLAFEGALDIPEKRIDLTVLVAPLKAVDSIIERIPIVGYILGENFMAIPVRVKGDLSDPEVTPMSPSAVGKGLLGILKRTLKLPFRVIQPWPDDAKNKSSPNS